MNFKTTVTSLLLTSAFFFPAKLFAGTHGELINSKKILSPTALSITVTQTQLPAGKGDVDQRILLINITGSSSTLNTVTVTIGGSTSVADVSTIKIYSAGTSNRFFDTKTLFGSASSAAGNIAITGSKALTSGSNNYFWVTYDVAVGATEGNLLDATCVSVKINTTTTSVSGNPSGSSPILLANKIVFKSNDLVTDGGVPSASQYFRIPAIITAANGDIVTATDARFGSSADLPTKADIIIRRSKDNGQTWLSAQTLADYGTKGAGDASLILDKTNNNILCFFASNNGLAASTPSNPIRLNMSKSTDNGATWSTPTDITDQIYGTGCSNATTKSWYAVWASAGRHTQLSSGRLLLTVGVRPTNAAALSNTTMYSDDHGVTWNIVTTLTNPSAGDESHTVQLNNGDLVMSSRINTNGTRKYRISTDLGATWGTQKSWAEINDSKCNGDFVRYSSTLTGDNMDILLHTIPASASTTRQNLTVFASQDEGATWAVKKTIFPGLAQYSSITRLSDGTIGIYYEMADPGSPFEMYFARFSLKWLGITGFTVLPVNLNSFNVLVQNNQPVLNWVTSAEENLSGYQVEHSTDGINFNNVGFVPSKNLKTTTTYSFTDKQAVAGKNFYRIKTIDIDGKFTYSKTLQAFVNDNAMAVWASPNPFSNKFSIHLNSYSINKKYLATILDSKGSVITKSQLTGFSTDIEAGNFSKGSYYIQVTNEKGSLISSQCILKQ